MLQRVDLPIFLVCLPNRNGKSGEKAMPTFLPRVPRATKISPWPSFSISRKSRSFPTVPPSPNFICARCLTSLFGRKLSTQKKALRTSTATPDVAAARPNGPGLSSRRSYTSLLTTAQVKQKLTELQNALNATPENPDKIWGAFVNLCEDPVTRGLIAKADAVRVIQMVMHRAEELEAIEQKLEYMQKQVRETKWLNLEVYIANAYIPRNREWFTYERAVRYLDDLKQDGLQPNRTTYILLIDALGSKGDGDGAAQVLRLMVEAGFAAVADVYHSIMLGYSRGGRPREAHAVLRHMESEGLPLTVRHYTTAMAGFAKQRDAAKTRELFAEMIGRGIKPTVVTFNVLLELCWGLEQEDMAEKVFHSIRKEGLIPGTDTYNIMITGLTRVSRLQDAVELFDDMGKSDVKRNEITYGAIIHGCAMDGLMMNAMKYYRALLHSGIPLNRYHFTILQSAFAAAKDMQTCQEVFRDLVARYRPSILNYNILISGWVRSGNLDKALDEFEKMKMAGHEPNAITWRRLIRGYLDAGRLEDALNAYMELKQVKPGPTVGQYIFLIDACCAEGSIQAALVLFQDMIDRGLSPIYSIYERIALVYLEKREPVPAAEWIGRLRRAGFKPQLYLYNTMIRAATLSSRPEAAFQFYKEMLADDVSPNSWTFNYLLLASFGDPRSVERVLQDMRAAGVSFDHYTYAVLIFLQSKHSRNFELAWQLWEEYISIVTSSETTLSAGRNRKSPVVHGVVARATLRSCAAHRRPKKAREVWDVILKYDVDIKAEDVKRFIRLAEGWAHQNIEKGEAILELMGVEKDQIATAAS